LFVLKRAGIHPGLESYTLVRVGLRPTLLSAGPPPVFTDAESH